MLLWQMMVMMRAKWTKKELKFYLDELYEQMDLASRNLEFELAAKIRDSDREKKKKYRSLVNANAFYHCEEVSATKQSFFLSFRASASEPRNLPAYPLKTNLVNEISLF